MKFTDADLPNFHGVESGFEHDSVFADDLVTMALSQNRQVIAIDCTAGGGGHTSRLLASKYQLVVAIDRDETAISHLRQRFATEIGNGLLKLVHCAFADISQAISALDLELPVGSIIADLGVSSPQLDRSERGFSFQKDGPLDMRMDRTAGFPASDWLNTADEGELADVIFRLGEEPFARKVASAIVKARQRSPILSTGQLAGLVSATVKYRTKSRTHPATRVFQAIRMHVNDEGGQLLGLLQGGFDLLMPGGRMAIISFHSLEDRLVKQFFRSQCSSPELPRELPITSKTAVKASLIRPFPLKPSISEIDRNRRARSAKLRAIEKK